MNWPSRGVLNGLLTPCSDISFLFLCRDAYGDEIRDLRSIVESRQREAAQSGEEIHSLRRELQKMSLSMEEEKRNASNSSADRDALHEECRALERRLQAVVEELRDARDQHDLVVQDRDQNGSKLRQALVCFRLCYFFLILHSQPKHTHTGSSPSIREP